MLPSSSIADADAGCRTVATRPPKLDDQRLVARTRRSDRRAGTGVVGDVDVAGLVDGDVDRLVEHGVGCRVGDDERLGTGRIEPEDRVTERVTDVDVARVVRRDGGGEHEVGVRCRVGEGEGLVAVAVEPVHAPVGSRCSVDDVDVAGVVGGDGRDEREVGCRVGRRDRQRLVARAVEAVNGVVAGVGDVDVPGRVRARRRRGWRSSVWRRSPLIASVCSKHEPCAPAVGAMSSAGAEDAVSSATTSAACAAIRDPR